MTMTLAQEVDRLSNPNTVQEAVTNGVLYLRKLYGGLDWIDKIDLDILEMASTVNCVAGQLGQEIDDNVNFDIGYYKFLKKHGLMGVMHSGVKLGFAAKNGSQLVPLRDEWIKRIMYFRSIRRTGLNIVGEVVNFLDKLKEEPLITTYYGEDAIQDLRDRLSEVAADDNGYKARAEAAEEKLAALRNLIN